MSIQTYRLRMTGGLDTSSAPMSVPEGCVIGSKNYIERVVDGGYESTGNYERFDGRPRPSDAEILAIEADGVWSTAAVVGATATGGISGATGTICYYSDTLIALTEVVGTFVNGEVLMVGAATIGIADTSSPSVSPLVVNEMYAGAADIYRAAIEAPPGSGPLLGACVIDNTVYAFRNNEAGTKQDVWKATTAGWVAIDYPVTWRVYFDTGNGVESDVGAFIMTQGSATVEVHRVMRNKGAWTAGDAEGVLALRGAPTGGTLTTGAATIAGLGTVNLTTVAAEAPLAPNGRWSFVAYKFNEEYFDIQPGALPVYGVDRVERAGLADGGGNCIEFDGYMATPLNAGGVDGPWRIACHKQHLFVVKRHTTLVHSGIENPYAFNALEGGGEIKVGGKVSALEPLQGSQDDGALAILCENRTDVLYGNDEADWNLVGLSSSVGAKVYSTQTLDSLIGMDKEGVRDFRPTQVFGNFTYNTLTNHVRANVVGRTPVASVVDRAGGRYRMFFADGSWLCGTPRKGRWAWMPGEYPVAMHFVQDWELDGKPVMLAGGTDGMLYMLDKGRSADGEPIEAWLKMAYAHCGDPMARKAFRGLSVEIRGESAGELQMMCDYSYGDTAISQNAPSAAINNPIPPPATPWDLGTWDLGTWDSQYATQLDIGSEGVGANVSTIFYSRTAKQLPHHITTLQHHSLKRRKGRGR